MGCSVRNNAFIPQPPRAFGANCITARDSIASQRPCLSYFIFLLDCTAIRNILSRAHDDSIFHLTFDTITNYIKEIKKMNTREHRVWETVFHDQCRNFIVPTDFV